MGLIELIVVLGVVGFILWLVVTYIPMPAPFKTVLIVIVVIALCLFLLRALGVGDVNLGARA